MKILMFGRGVIATQYGWALEKAGNQVDFYVRPGRIVQYGSTTELNIIDGRKKFNGTMIKENWSITMKEELHSDHDYDLIIVSVNHHQVDEVISFLAPRVGKATILMFNNIWKDPSEVVVSLPKEKVVWGFPGAGGGFENSKLLKGGFMKSIFLESIHETKFVEGHRRISALFTEAGFKISEKKNFRYWLWEHFIMNAAMAAQALKVEGYSNLYRSTANSKQVFLLMREMLPLIKAKGEKINLGTLLFLHLPAGLLGFGLKKIMTSNNLPASIMKYAEGTGHTTDELTSLYPKDVLAEARKLGVSLPRLMSLEPSFK